MLVGAFSFVLIMTMSGEKTERESHIGEKSRKSG